MNGQPGLGVGVGSALAGTADVIAAKSPRLASGILIIVRSFSWAGREFDEAVEIQ